MAVTWAECFAVHNLQRDDLLAAVIALYADHTRDKSQRTLPLNVIRYARRIRADRTEREKVQGAIDKNRIDASRRLMRRLPDLRPQRLHRHPRRQSHPLPTTVRSPHDPAAPRTYTLVLPYTRPPLRPTTGPTGP